MTENYSKSKDTRCDWCSPKGPLYFDIDPDRVGPGGSLHWHHRGSGSLHRDGAPAILGADGSKHWYQHGKLHREDGPAIELQDGKHKWYLHGQRLDFNQWLEQVTDSDRTRFQLALQWAGVAEEPA